MFRSIEVLNILKTSHRHMEDSETRRLNMIIHITISWVDKRDVLIGRKVNYAFQRCNIQKNNIYPKNNSYM